ncbi:MAG: hypothetical protein ABR861_04170 [Terriglobales bacterium]
MRDETGKPLSGSIGVTFTLYQDENGQAAVWQESQNVQLDSAGRYSALLGASNEAGLPLEIFSAGEARWLGIRPDGQAEQPRILLLSVAYALKAADTEMLGGKPASAFVLADSLYSSAQLASGTQVGSANSQRGSQILNWSADAVPLIQPHPATACTTITSDGTAQPNQIAYFNGACSIEGTSAILLPPTGIATASPGYNSNPLDLQASSWSGTSAITQDYQWMAESMGNSSNPSGSLNLLFGSNGSSPTETGLSIASNGGLTAPLGTFGGTATGAGAFLIPTGTATTITGFNSSPLEFEASVFNATLRTPVNYIFQWQAEPMGNNSTNTGATLNLLWGVTGLITETGLSVDRHGILTFASGQTFPGGSGTVTSVGETINSGSSSGIFAVTGSPVTASGTLNINLSGTSGGLPYFSSPTVLSSSGALTGIVRGGSPPTASEISGDGSTSGSNLLTVNGLNGKLLSGLATGLLKNTTSTGVPSIATYSDIVGLFSSCSGTQYLGYDGTCHSASGSGTVTSVGTASPITGGTITTTGTIGLMPCSTGQTLLWNGSWICGVPGSSTFSGTTDGIAYFSSPTNLTSTAAPSNGQILIGSTGNAPVLGTLTAGANISITNSPGSVTISAAGGGGGETLPFFVTAGARNGSPQAAVQNVTKLWGFLLPYNVTTTEITYQVITADNTANDYDIGIYSLGNLVVDIAPTPGTGLPGTTFAPSKGFHTLNWTQGSTALLAGRYYIAFTTNCKSTCATIGAVGSVISFAVNVSAGASSGGALPATMTPPADSWGTGIQPTVVIH